MLAILVSGCQTTTPVIEPAKKPIDYSQYYVWLKTLNNTQLLTEEKAQKSSSTDNRQTLLDSQGKLILIYSLPNSTLHQPFKAKRLLNNLLLSEHFLSEDNLAFTTLLRDQLNTQLHLLQKQEALTKSINKHNDNYNETINLLTKQLNQKTIDLEHVNKQLKLLKKLISASISALKIIRDTGNEFIHTRHQHNKSTYC
jgi:hypothetical protein